MHKLLLMLPRCVQRFLLNQPLPDNWIDTLNQKKDKPDDPHGHRLDLSAGWKQSYNLILAMVVLLIAGFIMYLILR